MEKPISASWCLQESNARIAKDVPAYMIFPRRKFRQRLERKTPRAFPRGVPSLRAKRSNPEPRHRPDCFVAALLAMTRR
jgi:hypothetical protein